MNKNKDPNTHEVEVEKETSVHRSESFFKKTSIVAKKVVNNVQEFTETTSQKLKDDSKERRKQKFRPLTMKEMKHKNFDIPNVIKIIDDADIRDIDVCEGAIGRLVTVSSVEILYLCDKYVKDSGLKFVPAPVCNAIYHVDNFDRTQYISTDEVFSKALEEKLAELEHIAFCLGAKSCSIEIVESNTESTKQLADFSVQSHLKRSKIGGSVAKEDLQQSKHSTSGKIISTFSGEATLKHPTLKWFAYNNNIKNLIDMRLSGGSFVSMKTLELKGSGSTSMTQKTAVAIDCEITKMGIKSQKSIEKQAQIEKDSLLIFEVEF